MFTCFFIMELAANSVATLFPRKLNFIRLLNTLKSGIVEKNLILIKPARGKLIFIFIIIVLVNVETTNMYTKSIQNL
jgi:hypothetical protein